jgi:hypothetical protein
MAGRPYKQGLDYFFMDTTIEDDEKILAVESDHKCLGFTVFVKMLCRIYKTHGYFIMFTPKQQKIYSNSINVDNNSFVAVINACIEEQLFNRELYEKYQILTSRSIQSRFLQSTKRRKSVQMIKDFCVLARSEVIKVNEKCDFLIYDDINSIFVSNNIINDYNKYASAVINVNLLYYTISINSSIRNISNEEFLKKRVENNNDAKADASAFQTHSEGDANAMQLKEGKGNTTLANITSDQQKISPIGIDRVKEAAKGAWGNEIWLESICMGHSLSKEEVKRWMAQFNASVCNDLIPDFNISKYQKLFGGWLNTQKAKGYKLPNNSSESTDLKKLQ